jgi:hypothetical protein
MNTFIRALVFCALLGSVSCSVGSAWFGDSSKAADSVGTRSGVQACLDAQAHQGFLGGLAGATVIAAGLLVDAAAEAIVLMAIPAVSEAWQQVVLRWNDIKYGLQFPGSRSWDRAIRELEEAAALVIQRIASSQTPSPKPPDGSNPIIDTIKAFVAKVGEFVVQYGEDLDNTAAEVVCLCEAPFMAAWDPATNTCLGYCGDRQCTGAEDATTCPDDCDAPVVGGTGAPCDTDPDCGGGAMVCLSHQCVHSHVPGIGECPDDATCSAFNCSNFPDTNGYACCPSGDRCWNMMIDCPFGDSCAQSNCAPDAPVGPCCSSTGLVCDDGR